jgi:aspartate kinase
MSTLVIKIGGNTLASESGFVDTIKVIANQCVIWDNLVVVTSAVSNVTDALHTIVQLALTGNRSAVREDIAGLREMHREIAHLALSNAHQRDVLWQELDQLFFDLLDDCDLLCDKKQTDLAIADRIFAIGERLVVRIMAAVGRSQGLPCVALDANRLLITDDRHGNARPITPLSQKYLAQNLLPLLDQHFIPIITGYIGANEKGAITTLGRGGSDYSATYLGALLAADEVWFFTDVAGLMSADPDLVPDAQILSGSSYQAVAEMARFGARVVHPHAIEPLMQAQIPLRIRPLEDGKFGGTYITNHARPQEHRIQAVTQALGLRVMGPTRSNMVEVCNRIISQYLNDDIQPTLQTDAYAGTMIIYIAPTSANPSAFYSSIGQLQSYDDSDEWQVDKVTVVAVVGMLKAQDMMEVLKGLHKAHLEPLAIAQGGQGVLLLAFDPDLATEAMRNIHKLVKV